MSLHRPSDIACFKCGGQAKLTEEIASLGQEPGRRVFQCVACDELTWTPITATPPSEPEKR